MMKSRVVVIILGIFLLTIFYPKLGVCEKHYKVYPVILVHGMSAGFSEWADFGTTDFLKQFYDCYNDLNARYSFSNNGLYSSGLLGLRDNVFGMSSSKEYGPIGDEAQELNWVINGKDLSDGTHQDGIREIMSKTYPGIFPDSEGVKVVIIAHSMGGLVAREYLRTRQRKGKTLARRIFPKT